MVLKYIERMFTFCTIYQGDPVMVLKYIKWMFTFCTIYQGDLAIALKYRKRMFTYFRGFHLTQISSGSAQYVTSLEILGPNEVPGRN